MIKSFKTLLTVSMLLAMLSCKTSTKEEFTVSGPNALDTLISNSNKNFEISSRISKETDSVVTNKVDNTVKKITKMEGEIKQLKKENNELKEKLDDANDDGQPFNIRSISNN